MKTYIIKVPIYNTRVRLIITRKISDVEKYIQRVWKDKDWFVKDEKELGSLFTNPEYAPIIFLRKVPKSSFEKGILAHEIFHCTAHILSTAGLKFSEDSEEAYTYLNGFLTEQIYTKLNK